MNTNQTRNLLLLLLIVVGTLPTQLFVTTFSENASSLNTDINALRGDTKYTNLPRLGSVNSGETGVSNDISTNELLTDQTRPNFAIGSQEGTGGGSITINDSFNWFGVENLSTQNILVGYQPTTREDTLTVSTPSDFSREDLSFTLTNITATPDWRLREAKTASSESWYSWTGNPGSAAYISLAMSFQIEEDYANLSELEIYHGDEGSPTGLIYIVNSSSNGQPNNTLRISSIETLQPSGNGWYSYSFSSNFTLQKDQTYFVIMNATTNTHNAFDRWVWFVEYYTNYDADAGDVFRIHNNNPGLWSEQADYDIPFQIRVKPVEKIMGIWESKVYDSTSDIKIWYNTTAGGGSEVLLNSFLFKANDTETHRFKSNTSITFNLTFTSNFTSNSNPIIGDVNYLVLNSSSSLWSVTFSTSAINTSYSIENHTIRINGLLNDWEGSRIYQNGSLVYVNQTSGWFNQSHVQYSNKSSVMRINSTSLSDYTNWNITFNAPNYIYDFNVSLGGTPLALSYETFTMNNYNLDFEVNETGNLTYWIDYPNGSQLLKQNIDDSTTSITDLWDIDSTFDQTTRVNGTYHLQAFWNNSDSTKVGTFTRDVRMLVNTSFSTINESEIIIGQLYNVTAFYTADHNNDEDILNAPIWCDINWTASSDKFMTLNVTDNSYNASFDTTNEVEGTIGNLTITTQMPWFENYTTTILVHFVKNASLTVNALELSLEWRENYTLALEYNITGGISISGATVTVEGVQATNYSNNVYYFELNSTDFAGVGDYTDLYIKANHTFYVTREWYFNLTITSGITGVTSSTISNNSNTNIAFSNSSSDEVSVNLQYYHILTNDNLSTSVPTVESLLPELTTPVGNSWTIAIDPNQTGIFIINITFSLGNYSNALFTFNITVQDAQTKIQTDYVNDTQVYYAESYTFTVYYNNTDWNENITFNPFLGVNLTISEESKIQFLNRTGDLYWFEFDYDPLAITIGFHSITITFQAINYFESSSILITFDVIKSPFVDLDVLETESVSNGTTFLRPYSPNDYDNLTLSFSYYANKTLQPLNIAMAELEIFKNPSISNISIKQLNFNWTLIFDGSNTGLFNINITFNHENYTSITFQVQYQIIPAQGTITDYDTFVLDNLIVGINASVLSGDSIEFWVVWTSQYGESIEDNNVTSSNDTLLIFLNSNESLGIYYHYFRYTGGGIGVDTINLTFGTGNYTDFVLTLYFEATNRGLVINNVLSTHPNPWTSPVGYLQYGDRYYFYITINDSENNNPVDISVFTNLDTYNITFVNVSNGNHLFYYDAWIIATSLAVPLSIQFSKANYASNISYINFFVKSAESIIAVAPPSVTTYYSQDLNFSIIWNSSLNPNAPFTPIYGINSTDVTSPLPVVFKAVDNGNYTFSIRANQTGVFDVTINFMSSYFENKAYVLTITILQVPTEFGVNLPSNESLIGFPTGFYYTETYDLSIGWISSFSDSGIQDSVPVITVNGSGNVSFVTSYIDGTHIFRITADTLGQYQVSITLETTNFGKLFYLIYFKVSEMPTSPLLAENLTLPTSIYVEESFTINGSGYQTIYGENITHITSFSIWFNETQIIPGQIQVYNDSYYFEISISTINSQYGFYNVSLLVNSTGYQSQIVNLTIILLGRSLIVEVSLPVSTIQQGEDITIDVSLVYEELSAGFGSTSMLAPWTDITVHYYIEMDFTNGSTKILETDMNLDALGHVSYLIPGSVTKLAVGFSNITVYISESSTSLPTSYSMSAEELDEIKITEFLDPLEILLPALIILLIILIVVTSVYYVNRKRVKRSEVKKFADLTVEKGFEDIKSIRLIIARHQSGLQFYAEKTIAELQADTDALSGMSAAMSSFLEELSDSMTSQSDTDKVQAKDKIEVMSREGLHMLVWHGNYSSLIIISESRLPDYFQSRLKILGHELEEKFINELKNFYSSDQVPSTVVKKMVRKYIPLHYFCAFVLNEGVLTLDSIKLTRKESKMLQSIKNIMFKIEGVNYFFSEQIISHLSQDYKRSEAIKFLDRAIKINLLIEAEQDDLLRISRR